MRKSQITIFIVLGIVVMVIFGLVYFVSKQTSDVVLEKKINKVYGDFLSSTSIKEYISNCLDISIKEAIRTSALQGGKIYSYQVERGYEIYSINETIPFNHSGIIYNISYGIKAPIPGFDGNLQVPEYPYPGPLVINSPVRSPFAFYNNSLYYPYTLTSLCNGYGPNYYNITNATYSCEVWDRLNASTQDHIEEYIEQRLDRCINFTQFTKIKYNISKGDINAFVLIGEYDVFVVIKYPIIINIKNKPPTTRFLDFSRRVDIRLKKIHELALHLIGLRSIIKTKEPETESDNIFFNITKDDPRDCRGHLKSYSFNKSCILSGMTVNKIKDYCLDNPICSYLPDHYKYSDIINITDKNSTIDGKPLTFLFAVENRVPALNFTPDITIGGGSEIEFFALDPDEDNLTYFINDDSFIRIEGNKFKAPSAINSYNVIINVSDNEGLYDYQDVIINVIP